MPPFNSYMYGYNMLYQTGMNTQVLNGDLKIESFDCRAETGETESCSPCDASHNRSSFSIVYFSENRVFRMEIKV